MIVLAVIRSYDALADALAVERRRRGISGFKLELETGMQFKQINKLEKKKKYPGAYLEKWLAGLGVALVLVREEETHGIKDESLPAHPVAYGKARKKSGRARSFNISRARRREIARNAARARWEKAGQ
jgi:transcriptional regulator with XRE-family HTH domain